MIFEAHLTGMEEIRTFLAKHAEKLKGMPLIKINNMDGSNYSERSLFLHTEKHVICVFFADQELYISVYRKETFAAHTIRDIFCYPSDNEMFYYIDSEHFVGSAIDSVELVPHEEYAEQIGEIRVRMQNGEVLCVAEKYSVPWMMVSWMADGGRLTKTLRRCECGGLPELIFDHVADYAYRCRECHLCTHFRMNEELAAVEWEQRDLIGKYEFDCVKFAEIVAREKIESLAFERDDSEYTGEGLAVYELIVSFESKKLFALTPERYATGKKVFDVLQIGAYNTELYDTVFLPKKAAVTRWQEEGEDAELRLQADTAVLSVRIDDDPDIRRFIVCIEE